MKTAGTTSKSGKDPEQMKSALKQPFKKRYISKSAQHKIYIDSEDATPLPLQPVVYEAGQEKQLGVYDMNESALRSSRSEKSIQIFGAQEMSKFQTELHNQMLEAQSMFGKSYLTATVHVEEDVVLFEPESSEAIAERGIMEAGVDVEEAREVNKVPADVTVVLTETPTFYIFDWPSSTAEKGTEQGDYAEKDNEMYDYLTVGKGRNRKVLDVEVQTLQILTKTRDTETPKVHRKHNYAFASNWDMYDTFNEPEAVKKASEAEEDPKLMLDSAHSFDSFQITMEERQMCKLLRNPRFQEALSVMERLLANNNFNTQQKRFRGLLGSDPFREDVKFNYKLDLLWTFANSDTAGKCVVALDWNPVNEDILAVGYGKFCFKDTTLGMVMIWNIKNPVQPERCYNFDAPLTSLQFSRQHHNLLAVGMYDGKVKVISIDHREKTVCSQSTAQDAYNFEPVWEVRWHKGDDYYADEDQLFTANQDGVIRKFRITGTVDMKCLPIMNIVRPEGHLKGIETLKKCSAPGIPICRYSPALVLTNHPADPNVYFVGTAEGIVHRCSTDYYHQHLDLFMAHDGPMYQMKFSPFCNRLFLTCGDDCTIRIWCDGIFEPLLELTRTMQSVQGADWSPSHSTIIASICGGDVYIWDIQRKAYLPQSVTATGGARNTVVQFTPDGRCLVVGDVDGNVRVFALDEMPFAAFFQQDLLVQALKKSMQTKPALLKQIKKMGKLNFEKSQFETHFR